jgi:shikimate dehydrogenase
MQEAALEAMGIEGVYQRLPVPPERFEETVRALREAGFIGANVTIPHKEAALRVARNRTHRAVDIGAANTLDFTGRRIYADNTDAPGLIAAIGEPVRGRDALVLGAGGSARAAVWALREEGAKVTVHNRTRARAETLGVDVADDPVATSIVVNCTSVGLEDPDRSPADVDCDLAVDLVYGARETAFLRNARQRGARTVDGLEVLVRQGALSLRHWTGQDPPLDVMRQAVRS